MTGQPRPDVTAVGLSPAAVGADADRIREAVLACPDVVGLFGGAFGEIRSYLPGRSVAGVRVDEERVQVHVVARYGPPLTEVATQIGSALAPLLADRPLRVVVEDIVVPGEAAEPDGAATGPALGEQVP